MSIFFFFFSITIFITTLIFQDECKSLMNVFILNNCGKTCEDNLYMISYYNIKIVYEN